MSSSGQSWEELTRIKSCGVFFMRSTIYVVASARTIPGFEISVEPIFELNRSSPAADLGEAIISALNSYRMDMPPPSPRGVNRSLVLRSFNMKSWRQLERAALYIHVTLDDEIVGVMPATRDAKRGGYIHRPNEAAQCAFRSEEIGKTVFSILERCS